MDINDGHKQDNLFCRIYEISATKIIVIQVLSTDKTTLKVTPLSIYYKDKTDNFLCPCITSIMIPTDDIPGDNKRTRRPTIFSVMFFSTPVDLLSKHARIIH